MPQNQDDTIYPCPFSKAYGIPKRQAWLLLKVFFLYRFILSSLFVILYHSALSKTVIEANYLQLYNYTSKSYLVLSILSGIFIVWREVKYTLQAQSVIFIDIIALTLIMHTCGGISNGFGILIAASLAASGLLIGGRCSMVFAALATVSILSEQVYAIRLNEATSSSYPTAGMLGATFFMTALLSYILAKRSEQSDLLTHQQKQTITTLEELNQYIIQHLQSGIIISNKYQHIFMTNEAALKLLNQAQQPQQLSDLSEQLSVLFQDWLNDSSQDFMILSRPKQANLHLRFSLLNTRHEIFYMLILEDITLHNQRLQQGVLASLGRLTANIAHEIRNPLSAISHAGELLAENPQLDPQDLRLTEIIQTHSHRINKIINDILQSSKRQASNHEQIQLDEWMVDYVNAFTSEYGVAQQKLHLHFCHRKIHIMMDQGHLKQILDNLCQNALKYGCQENDAITLKVSNYYASACIEVIDNGQLLDSKIISHLFEPFFTTSPTGTGLGLYISRELAQLNQAKLNYVLTAEQKNSFKLCLSNAEKTKIAI